MIAYKWCRQCNFIVYIAPNCQHCLQTILTIWPKRLDNAGNSSQCVTASRQTAHTATLCKRTIWRSTVPASERICVSIWGYVCPYKNICVCVCVHMIRIYVCVCIDTDMCVHMRICVSIQGYVCMCVCPYDKDMRVRLNRYGYVCPYKDMCVHIRIFVFVRVSIW